MLGCSSPPPPLSPPSLLFLGSLIKAGLSATAAHQGAPRPHLQQHCLLGFPLWCTQPDVYKGTCWKPHTDQVSHHSSVKEKKKSRVKEDQDAAVNWRYCTNEKQWRHMRRDESVFQSGRETGDAVQNTDRASWANTLWSWELHFGHTSRHQDKQALQLAYMCKTGSGSTCKLLSKGLLPLLCLTSALLSFSICTPAHSKHGFPDEHFRCRTFYELLFSSSGYTKLLLTSLNERSCWVFS